MKTVLMSGVTLLAETEGEGPPAAKGDRVVYNLKIWLNHGDEVPLNAMQIQYLPQHMIRSVDGEKLIDHTTILGSREAVAGVERSLVGMKSGGYRKVRVSPHLAYRDNGLPGLIPERAVLIFEIWVRSIRHPQQEPGRNG
jgi:FKBP-type peptidyl-prolyl cis-trans isomerase